MRTHYFFCSITLAASQDKKKHRQQGKYRAKKLSNTPFRKLKFRNETFREKNIIIKIYLNYIFRFKKLNRAILLARSLLSKLRLLQINRNILKTAITCVGREGGAQSSSPAQPPRSEH